MTEGRTPLMQRLQRWEQLFASGSRQSGAALAPMDLPLIQDDLREAIAALAAVPAQPCEYCYTNSHGFVVPCEKHRLVVPPAEPAPPDDPWETDPDFDSSCGE